MAFQKSRNRNLIPQSLRSEPCTPDLQATVPRTNDKNAMCHHLSGATWQHTSNTRIDVIVNDNEEELIPRDDITCEDHFQEVLKIQKSPHPLSGSTTSPSDSFPSLTSSKTSDSSLEEFANEPALLDPFPLGNKDDNFDPEADLREIEY
nr:hypothetical protein [Tanacetum cinerariifolium]